MPIEPDWSEAEKERYYQDREKDYLLSSVAALKENQTKMVSKNRMWLFVATAAVLGAIGEHVYDHHIVRTETSSEVHYKWK
jgi:hypothetical protein